MSSRKWIAALLITLVGAPLQAAPAAEVDFLALLMRKNPPRGYIAAMGAGERKAALHENPRAAFEWRYRTMLDEHGRIPPNAFSRANEHRRNNRRRGRPSGLRLTTQAATLAPFSWISRGPQNVGGRTLALLVHPTNNQLLFAGAASGGIWKSTNGGSTWTPINDFMANLQIGALAFDPLNPNTMYAGTGERFYDRVVRNSGVFKSTDGGTTWTQLTATANWVDVQTIAPQPGSSNVLLAATGDGIYRTTNGGTSWTQSTVPNLEAALQVAFDPGNGTRAVAAIRRNDNTVRAYYSTDGGQTFTAATGTSLSRTNTFFGDVAVAYAPSQTSRVYALVNGGNQNYSELWRSDDNGVNYTRLATGSGIGCIDRRCTLWVAPTDASLVVSGGLDVYRSTDAGASFTIISMGRWIMTADAHVDQHCIVHDPFYNGSSNRRVFVCTDGGVWRATDIANATPNSGSWTPLTASYQTTQFYGGAGHAVGAGLYLGGTQDNGNLYTTNLTSNATLALEADGGFVEIDPTDPDTWYMEQQNMRIHRTLDGGANVQGIWPPESVMNFIAPFILDPNDSDTLYAGGSRLWRTTNATAPSVSWSQVRSAGGTFDDNISAIAVAPGNSDIVYVGQNNGIIQKTTNGTAGSPTWTDVDNNGGINPLPNRYVTRIYVDPSTPNTVYVALGGFTLDNLWKSTNGGTTFVSASGSGTTSLPPAPVRGIVRHPVDPQRLYAGTDVGIYESEDGGASWLTSEAGPADVMIDELRFVNGTQTLLAATHGRGLWTADVTIAIDPPTNLVATATSTSSVSLTWTGVTGATSYQILRSVDNSAYSVLTTVSTTSHTDNTAVAGKTYLYKVKALAGTASSPESNLNFATTILFTDDNQLSGKVIGSTHLQEIRSAVNAVRVSAGLAPLTFGNPGSNGSPILANDVSELRTGLVAAYNQLSLTPPSFAETLTAGSTPVKASHVQEVRNATK